MEELKNIKQCLVGAVQGQLGDLKKTNAKELGEVIDMIKDLEEAMYYCSITEAMNNKENHSSQSQNNIAYFTEPDNKDTHQYYGGGNYYYSDDVKQYVPYMEYAPYMMRDDKWRDSHLYEEGRSNMSRRMYMEGKHKNQSDVQSMKDLETYVKDLSDDMVEMLKDSTPEEKQVLSSKLQALASKVNK